MVIRDYRVSDEKAWLACRVVSFLDCSYYNDVKTEKERYEQPAICLVAEEDGCVVGFIDVELDSEDLTANGGVRGAVIWHLGVLPEYRNNKVATRLWLCVKERLLQAGIRYCEVWTQQDVPANRFYLSNGFALQEEQTWLRCYLSGKNCAKLLQEDAVGGIYGAEELILDVPKAQRDKWQDRCYRMDEVRLYSIRF